MSSKGDCPRQSGDSSQEQPRGHTKAQPCDKSRLLLIRGTKTRWQRLRDALIPHLRDVGCLSESYAEAAVRQKQSEAQKATEQAAEIVARTNLIKQKEVKEFNICVDDIFALDGLPPVAKALKLAKLMENNPQLKAHILAANEILKELPLPKYMDEPPKSLPCDGRKEEQS